MHFAESVLFFWEYLRDLEDDNSNLDVLRRCYEMVLEKITDFEKLVQNRDLTSYQRKKNQTSLQQYHSI